MKVACSCMWEASQDLPCRNKTGQSKNFILSVTALGLLAQTHHQGDCVIPAVALSCRPTFAVRS